MTIWCLCARNPCFLPLDSPRGITRYSTLYCRAQFLPTWHCPRMWNMFLKITPFIIEASIWSFSSYSKVIVPYAQHHISKSQYCGRGEGGYNWRVGIECFADLPLWNWYSPLSDASHEKNSNNLHFHCKLENAPKLMIFSCITTTLWGQKGIYYSHEPMRETEFQIWDIGLVQSHRDGVWHHRIPNPGLFLLSQTPAMGGHRLPGILCRMRINR